MIIGVYIDDLLVKGTKISSIKDFSDQMNCKFEMNNLGKLAHYLGLEVKQGLGNIQLKQTAYAVKILEKAGLWYCNATKLPLDPKEYIDKDEGGQQVDPTL